MGVRTIQSKIDELNAAVGVGGGLHGVKVGLYTNPLSPTDQTVLADLTEPTYPGYAQKAVTPWTVAFVGGNGLPQVDGGDYLFQMDDSTVPTLVQGFFLVQPAVTGPPAVPAYLVEVFPFAVPVALQTPLDGCSADVVSNYGD